MSDRRSVPRLMLVTDRRQARFPLPELARRAAAGGVDAIQIREKDLTEAGLERVTAEVMDEIGGRVAVIINGSDRVARRLGTGLHLPERDQWRLPGIRAEIAGVVGCSVHAADVAAATAGADYQIAGHVYPTASKPGRSPIGVDGFRDIVAASTCPVLAIGGVTAARIPELIAAGARGVAVLSTINNALDPTAAAAEFHSALERAMIDADATEMISLTINGKPAEIPAGSTIMDYLVSRGHHDRMVVVELNGSILRRPVFASTALSTGDTLEIVHFVGGG